MPHEALIERAAFALDATQQQVLELPAGASAVVLGAPGTGKTRTLIEFAADRILRLGLGTDAVLALAPRRTQASRLRDALLTRVGLPARGPMARTTVSLAFDIARRSAVLEGRPQPVLLSGGEQDALIAQLLADTSIRWPESLSPEVRGLTLFRTELRDLLARATERGVDGDGLRTLAAVHGRDEWRAVADFADEYLRVLGEVHPDAFDSAELVSLAAAGVQRGTAGETVDALRVVLVDDLQDATESTMTLLATLAERGVAIVGFGDPDVAVDTFRGGEPDALARFGERLGIRAPARIVLGTAHRTPPEVRALIQTVTGHIGTALAGDQRAATAPDRQDAAPGNIVRIEAPTAAEQALDIAHIVRDRHLRHGVGYGDQAVVVRSGSLAEPLARALEGAGIPTVARTTGLPLRDDRAARALLDVVATGLEISPLTPESAVDLLTGPFGGLDRLALRRLRLALRAEELAGDGTRSAGELLVEALAAPGRLVTIDAAFARRAGRLADTLQAVRDGAAAGDSVEALLWGVWERSGLAEPWRQRALSAGASAAEANRDLDGLVALFSAAARAVERAPEDPPAAFITAQLEAEVPDDTLAPRANRDSLLVTTAVGVAGLEFDTVIVAGLQEGMWPNLRPRGSLLAVSAFGRAVAAGVGEGATPTIDDRKAILSDELRLFALAISRARTKLVLTAVVNDEEAPSVLLTLGADEHAAGHDGVDRASASPRPPAVRRADRRIPNSLRPLVGQLRRALVSGPQSDRDAAAAALARLAAEQVPGADPASWHGLADASTTAPIVPDTQPTVRVSPSALDSFEKSPLDWFIDRVAGGESGLANAVGTMLHWVMETATVPDEAAMLAALEGRWRELDFEAEWIGAKEHRLAEQMVAAIGAYLRAREAAGVQLVGGEVSFTFVVGPAEVSGTLDRIERQPDGSIVVVDLKTGSPSGHVRAGDVEEHAQLGAYQLAVLEGAVEGVEVTAPRAGASLLYVRTTTKEPYKLMTQAALDAASAARIRERLATAAEGMRRAEFRGLVEPEQRHGSTSTRATLARIPEVCSD